MARKRYPPTDPREWLNRARSNLELAKNDTVGVLPEDLCFEAQQAAEKAIGLLPKNWSTRNGNLSVD